MKAKNPHLGSSLDDFLAEEGLLADAEATAVKRVLAYQLQQQMDDAGVTKSEMAKRMETSRAAVDRLLDPDSASVTLSSISRAAVALGKRVTISLADPKKSARKPVGAAALRKRRSDVVGPTLKSKPRNAQRAARRRAD